MPNPIPPRAVLLFALAVQVFSTPPLWGHQSTGGAGLGRYSERYALVLSSHIALTLLFVAAVPLAGWLVRRLRALPRWLIGAAYGLSAAVLVGLWSLSLERHALAYLSLNWAVLVAFVALALPDGPLPGRVRAWVGAVAGASVLLLLVAWGISALSMNIYEPDEAHYTDYASTFLAEGRLYDRTWLAEPQLIKPGRPWSLAGYALLIDRFGYDVRVGRVINLVGYALAFAGVYVATSRLYGRAAAVLGAGAMMLSYAIMSQGEFRPAQLVTAAGAWGVVLLVRARSLRRLWPHTLIGLYVTLALNIHAAMIVFALAFSLLYAGEAAYRLVRPGDGPRWQAVWPVLAFGVGALIGTGVYVVTNVLPVGGFAVYLGGVGERLSGGRPWHFFYTRWDSLYEKLLIAAAVAFLVWRRRPADRFVLALLALVIGSAVLLDSEGYIWHIAGVYFIPVGALLADGFTAPGMPPAASRRVWWVGASVLLVLAVQLSTVFINWPAVQTVARTGDLPPYFYNDLKTVLPGYITDDDVIYSTHQLIWLFPQGRSPQLVSYAAERNAMRFWDLDAPVEVWERVGPTVLVFVAGHMTFDPGMVAYMERHPFEVCHELTVQGRTVSIYRKTDQCPAPYGT
jgi:hypothetical protein